MGVAPEDLGSSESGRIGRTCGRGPKPKKSDAEVSQRRLVVIGEQDVCWTDAAVHYAESVCPFERAGDLHTQLQNLI